MELKKINESNLVYHIKQEIILLIFLKTTKFVVLEKLTHKVNKMFSNNPFNPKQQKNELRDFDSAAIDRKDEMLKREINAFIEDTRQMALNVVYALVDTITQDNLADDELPSDCFDALITEAIGDDDNATYYQALTNSIVDVFLSFGVDESTILKIFEGDIDVADTAIEAAVSTVIANIPDDGDALYTFEREFIYGVPTESDPDEKGFDSATGKKLSRGQITTKTVAGRRVHYKAQFAIRDGVQMVVNRRLGSQKLALSAKQRGAIKKAQLKALSANAIKKRVKSITKGRKMKLYS